MNRSTYFNFIEEKLSSLATSIESRGKLNLLDSHIHAEMFYRDFFNLLFDWNLEKTENHNEPGIDLVYKTNNIVVSVSAKANKEKIESSLEKIDSSYSGCSFKFISISKEANKLKTKTYLNPHNLKFSPSEDIYDVDALLKLILVMQIDHQRQVYEFLKKELDNETTPERLKPIERLKNYLQDRNNWKIIEEGSSLTFHYEQFPEFTIVENVDFYEKYEEPWILEFRNKRDSSQLEYLVKYHGTILSKIYIVRCDGGLFLTAKPKMWIKESHQTYYYTYYFVEDKIEDYIEYLAGQMISEIDGSVNCRNPSILNEFKLFKSEEEASQLIGADFDTGRHQYIYYCFDEEKQRFLRIDKGRSYAI
ncbi:MAG: SMEK domain-containing protein [Methylococcaceae bacterium]|nr:SMEK domain-containing protein [Methylococcaceae bacterium]MDP3902460.1 SMEK domain-containing protein [Methylococcaceae bacterium]